MDVQHGPRAPTSSCAEHSHAHLHGRWLLLARGGWITLVLFTLSTFFSSLPMYSAFLQTLCAGSTCQYLQLTSEQAETLKELGLSLADYAVFTLALAFASIMMCLIVSILIIWRRSDDRMAFFVALMLGALGPIIMAVNVPMSGPPLWVILNQCLSIFALALLVLVFLLFPDGRFAPNWTRWTLVVFLTVQITLTFLPTAPLLPDTPIVSQIGWLAALGEMATIAGIQLYRYRRVSSPQERQQTKWVVFGLTGPIIIYASLTVSGIFPEFASSNPLYLLAFNEAGFLLPLFVPLSFGLAILRYRLWDIDVLIRRTLVYGALTVTLTGVYVGLVIGLQALLHGFISQDNNIVIILSTLTIAALFQPLRARIQALIDRRFYRRTYDTAKTLQEFSASLHNEVDVNQLSEQVMAVVQETMQPASVSLLLCQLRQEKRTRNHLSPETELLC